MLMVQRVPGGARKALLQRRVVQLGSLTARRDRLLEPDAMAAMPTREGGKRSGPSPETQLLGGRAHRHISSDLEKKRDLLALSWLPTHTPHIAPPG